LPFITVHYKFKVSVYFLRTIGDRWGGIYIYSERERDIGTGKPLATDGRGAVQ
jgi:hypothetical protein